MSDAELRQMHREWETYEETMALPDGLIRRVAKENFEDPLITHFYLVEFEVLREITARAARSLVENYDPNFTRKAHTVEIDLKMWEHARTMRCEVSGNISGKDVLDDAPDLMIGQWFDRNEAPEGVEFLDEDGLLFRIKLWDPEGNSLEVEVEDEGDFYRLIVGIRIVDVKPYPKEG